MFSSPNFFHQLYFHADAAVIHQFWGKPFILPQFPTIGIYTLSLFCLFCFAVITIGKTIYNAMRKAHFESWYMHINLIKLK